MGGEIAGIEGVVGGVTGADGALFAGISWSNTTGGAGLLRAGVAGLFCLVFW